jgi:hypothetical protein
MFHPRINTLIILGLSLFALVGFWLLDHTTPARLGSGLFFLLVACYALYSSRADILAVCTMFFGVYDIYRYLLTESFPFWLTLIAIPLLIFLIWLILFETKGWFLSVLSALLSVELMLAMQYINLDIKMQAFITVIPFVFLCQYLYFRVYLPELLASEASEPPGAVL